MIKEENPADKRLKLILIKELHLKGNTLNYISEKTGFSTSQVFKILKNYDHFFEKNENKINARNYIIEHYKTQPFNYIAKKLSLNYDQLEWHLKNLRKEGLILSKYPNKKQPL